MDEQSRCEININLLFLFSSPLRSYIFFFYYLTSYLFPYVVKGKGRRVQRGERGKGRKKTKYISAAGHIKFSKNGYIKLNSLCLLFLSG